MKRLVLVAVLVVAGCRDRKPEAKRSPEPAGSAAATAPAPAPPPRLPAPYAKLLGDKPGTRGPALGNLQFGEIIDPDALPKSTGTMFGFLGEVPPRVLARSTDPGPKVLVNLEIRGGQLFAFRIELLTEKGSIPEDNCAGVAQAIAAKWGPAPERIWIDRDAHVRAALVDTCILTFERYVEPAAWIGPEPTAIVPAYAVGKPAKELASRVGPDVSLTESVTFRAAGVGEHASGPSLIDIAVHKKLVSGIGVETAAGPADRIAIRERISSAFGAKPTRDTVTGYDVWTTKPPIRMLETPSGVRVEVGNLTP